MATKETFRNPILRVRISRVVFPKICPVCGEEATHTNQIVTSPRKTKFFSSGPMTPYDRRRLGIPLPEVRTFHVHVCDDHGLEDGGIMRFRAATTFYASLAVALLIFAIMMVGSDLWLGRPISFWAGIFFMFFGAMMILSYIAFKPYGLEVAFRIVGFDYDMRHVWLQLLNPHYRDAMIQQNSMNAELVSWIVRG